MTVFFHPDKTIPDKNFGLGLLTYLILIFPLLRYSFFSVLTCCICRKLPMVLKVYSLDFV